MDEINGVSHRGDIDALARDARGARCRADRVHQAGDALG
jgi:hypothetical protein